MEHRIITADYHRNGVGGAGFYVAIVETTEDGERARYLCIDFAGDPEDRDYYDESRFAVLRVDQIADGNIAMHPLTDPDTEQVIEGTGGAAYRGADRWGRDLRGPIRDWTQRSWEAGMRRHAAEEGATA